MKLTGFLKPNTALHGNDHYQRSNVTSLENSFVQKHAAGLVRESKSSHFSPTFCEKKANGK